MQIMRLTLPNVRRAYTRTALTPNSEPGYRPERREACPFVTLAISQVGGEARFRKYGGHDNATSTATKILGLTEDEAEAFRRGVLGVEEAHWEAPGHILSRTRRDCRCCRAWRAGLRIRRAFGWAT